MKYRIIRDERWPDYVLIQDPNGVEIPEDLVKRLNKVTRAYDAVQDEIEAIDKASRGGDSVKQIIT